MSRRYFNSAAKWNENKPSRGKSKNESLRRALSNRATRNEFKPKFGNMTTSQRINLEYNIAKRWMRRFEEYAIAQMKRLNPEGWQIRIELAKKREQKWDDFLANMPIVNPRKSDKNWVKSDERE